MRVPGPPAFARPRVSPSTLCQSAATLASFHSSGNPGSSLSGPLLAQPARAGPALGRKTVLRAQPGRPACPPLSPLGWREASWRAFQESLTE